MTKLKASSARRANNELERAILDNAELVRAIQESAREPSAPISVEEFVGRFLAPVEMPGVDGQMRT